MCKRGYQYSYGELHKLFLEEIVNKIAPRNSSQVELKKVEYPKGLDEGYGKSLYPRDKGK